MDPYTPSALGNLLPQIMTIAEEAGDSILAIYHRSESVDIRTKADATPVTEADLAAHQLICSSLSKLTPDIPVLSEESDPILIRERRQWQRYWLVDPLDGTKEFIKRNGEFTVNIALVENGQSVLGTVHVPVSATTYGGGKDVQAVKRSEKNKIQPIHCRSLTTYKALHLLTSRSHGSDRLKAYVSHLEEIAPVSVTPVGSSLKLCLLAEGMADIHLRLGRTCEWDTAAAQAVLEAAGGKVMDLDLQELRYNQKDDLYNPDFMAVADPEFHWQDYLSVPE